MLNSEPDAVKLRLSCFMPMFFNAELSLYTFFWESPSANAQYVPRSRQENVLGQCEPVVRPRGGWLRDAHVAKPTHLKSTERRSVTPDTPEEVGAFKGILLRLLEVAVSGLWPRSSAVRKGKVKGEVGEGTCSGCCC